MEHPALVVLCTCPDEAAATALATDVVERGLAACVNRIAGVRALYRWEGRVVDDTEVLLLIKTTPARWPALADALRAGHPYEVPEIIALPVVAGTTDYLDWIAQATTR